MDVSLLHGLLTSAGVIVGVGLLLTLLAWMEPAAVEAVVPAEQPARQDVVDLDPEQRAA